MENQYLAKSNPKKTIIEHTQDLLDQLAILKDIYPSILEKEGWELLEYAVKYHDLGKINTKFQNKLYKRLGEDLLEDNIEGEEIPHNFLSSVVSASLRFIISPALLLSLRFFSVLWL